MRQAHIKNVVKTEIPVIDKKVLDSHPAFKNMSLKSPIPKNSRFRVQFDLLEGSAALANAIRLTVCEELQWKAFELDPKDIVTTEKNILINELCDRIMLLPLNQNVNEDAIYKIEAVADAHTKTSKTSTIVRSSAIEQSGGYQGLYFVLAGHLSPLDGIGPQELGIPQLLQYIKQHQVQELILATNATVEGEATAHYLRQATQHYGIKVTRIAHGVPLGGELEMVDSHTLARALSQRQRY